MTNAKATDLSYTTDGFTITFTPETHEGVKIYNELFGKLGSTTIPRHWFPSLSMQLKAAGYIVRKQRASKPQGKAWNASDEALLAALFA